jgi:hypothetical protein
VNGSPRDFGDVVLSLWPDVLWVLAALCALLAGIWCWAAAGALADRRRLRRERDLPALSRAIGAVERRTRAMSAAESDAVNGPGLGELTGPDYVVTGQLAAVQDALTPRMVAPTRADLDSARQRCHRCRTGSAAFRCTCDSDCFEAYCNGGLA